MTARSRGHGGAAVARPWSRSTPTSTSSVAGSFPRRLPGWPMPRSRSSPASTTTTSSNRTCSDHLASTRRRRMMSSSCGSAVCRRRVQHRARQARHDLVIFVQQDIYLPRGWDSRFLEQFREAERQFGSIGVAGVFGYTFGPEGQTHIGRVLDRNLLHDRPIPLQAMADGLDEIILAGAARHAPAVRPGPEVSPLRGRPLSHGPQPRPRRGRPRRPVPAQLPFRLSVTGLPRGA